MAVLGHAVRAHLDATGRQVVDVVIDGGYHPDAIVARARVPLRLVFHRADDDACFERVIFSSPRIDRRLATRGPTIIDLPAQPPGEIRFTCGMGRYRGRIQLVAEERRSRLARFRDEAPRLKAPLGTAVVLWLCSLPLLVLLAGFGLDPAATVAVAGFAFLASAAGCLWAYRNPADQA